MKPSLQHPTRNGVDHRELGRLSGVARRNRLLRLGPFADWLRFWSHVRKTENCWLWEGATENGTAKGYGVFGIGTHENKQKILAHIFAYRSCIGPIPEGKQLDHLCRVRHCVNPSHLEPVTLKENVLRGVGLTAENARKTHCKRGHPLSGENLTIWNGTRQCRICRRVRGYAKRQTS